jgi:hypothetical protein
MNGKSLRRHEGYLLIDNSHAPAISPEEAAKLGKAHIAGLGVKKLEAAILTCHHCQRQMVKNLLRTRPRAYCPKCDHYICDWCEAERVKSGGMCVPMKKKLDEAQEAAALAEQKSRHGLLDRVVNVASRIILPNK